MEMVGAYINANINGVEYEPMALMTPTVAAPAPKIVNGPRNKPAGARIIKTSAKPRVVFGRIPPSIGSKKGAATPAIRLKMGRTNRKPSKLATSTTPS